MENIHDLEIRPVQQNDVTSNNHMGAIGRWRRQTALQLFRARIHLCTQSGRKRATNYQLPFQPRGQSVAIPQPWGQVVAVINIPAPHGLAIVVGVIMISFMVFAEFITVVAAPVIVSFILGKSLAAAQRKYCRDKQR